MLASKECGSGIVRVCMFVHVYECMYVTKCAMNFNLPNKLVAWSFSTMVTR
jgi:hypothetical protein